MSLEVDQLTKTYGEQRAVDNISFSARPGEILGFLGPNGAGKSTTMKMVTCYLPPTSGQVRVHGHSVTKEPLTVRRKIGYLPENNPLYLDMYVKEYLAFVAALHGLNHRQQKSRIAEMLALVGLEREQHKQLRMLSKGYRQRIGLAQALIHNPEVLVLDEPTTGLDPNQILEIRGVIKNVSQQKTVIFSTHIMQEVQALCDRVVIIDRGKLVANSPIAELNQSGSGKKITITFAQAIDPAFLSQVAGVDKVEKESIYTYRLSAKADQDPRPNIFWAAVANNATIVGLNQKEVSVEEVFQQLTKAGAVTPTKASD